MWISLVLLVLAAAAAYFYLQKKKQKNDRDVLKPAPWDGRVNPGDTVKPPETPGVIKVAVKSKPPAKPKAPEKPVKANPPAAVKNPVKQAPVKKTPKPVPKGWFRKGNFIFRNKDSAALWNVPVARKTKRIDFVSVGDGRILPEQVIGDINLHRLALNVFRMPDADFSGTMTLTVYLSKAVMYLCDKTGKVHDYAVAAEGKNKNEVFINYKAGSFVGGPYIVQASNGISAGSTFRKPRPKR